MTPEDFARLEPITSPREFIRVLREVAPTWTWTADEGVRLRHRFVQLVAHTHLAHELDCATSPTTVATLFGLTPLEALAAIVTEMHHEVNRRKLELRSLEDMWTTDQPGIERKRP